MGQQDSMHAVIAGRQNVFQRPRVYTLEALAAHQFLVAVRIQAVGVERNAERLARARAGGGKNFARLVD